MRIFLFSQNLSWDNKISIKDGEVVFYYEVKSPYIQGKRNPRNSDLKEDNFMSTMRWQGP